MNVLPEQMLVLRKIAEGLGDLRDEVVLVGGMATGLLVTDPGAAEARPTIDVDFVIEVESRVDYYRRVRERLRARGFREDIREGAPLCRWLLDGHSVDVMPTDPEVLGFSNDWYPHAIATAERVLLTPDEAEPLAIRLVSAPAFCAMKLASFASRGDGDLLHRDIEDVISLIDGRGELLSEIEADSPELRTFLAVSISTLLRAGLEEHVASHLPGDFASQAREPLVVAILQRIADL